MTDTITQQFLDDFQEINMSNFSDDDVAALTAWGIAAHALLSATLAQQAAPKGLV